MCTMLAVMTAADALRHRPVGIWTGSLEALPAGQLGSVGAELDELGFGSLWYGEAYGRESFTVATVLATATANLVVGTGIANIYARGPMTTSGAGRLVEALAPGRFVLGLGVSHQPLVERDRGVEYRPPLTAMREYLDALGRAPYFGRDTEMPPVVIAALGPAMLALARDATAGAHPYLVTPDHTHRARETLGDGPLLVVEQAVVLGQNREEGLRRGHEHLNIYTGLSNYRNSWFRQGFDESDAVRGGSERLVDALVTIGDERAVLERAREHLDAGADHVCLQVLGPSPGDVPLDDWRRLAPALVGATR